VSSPSFNITQIFALRDRLTTKVFFPRFGQTVEGPVVEELVEALAKELPDDISVDTIYETVRQLLLLQLTDKTTKPWAWRLAANIPLLRRRQIIRPWTIQHGDEWVPLQVLHVRAARNYAKKPGHMLTLRVLAGTPAPMTIEKFWTRSIMHVLARRIGFSRREGKRPFQDPHEYTNLRFCGQIEAAKSSEKPFFHHVDCPPNFLAWNKELADRRYKLKFPCPRGWRHPCHHCIIGYDQCPAGTHYRTYVMQECTLCGKAAATEPGQPYCVICTDREKLRNG
jgi:hypothetical protein